jgi:hypothetical protein
MATSDVPFNSTEDFLETIFGKDEQNIKEVLCDPTILFRYKKALDNLVIGENPNKVLLFLIGLTSHMRKVLGAIIMGESSTGKSHLMNSVLKFFSNVEEYTRITEASPDRLAQDFSHKILKVGELHGTEKAQSSLRVWISEGKLRLLTTTRGEDGKITTEVLETNGVPCFITTTTSVNPDEELLNRLFLISIDESESQTRQVLEYEAQEFIDPDFESKMQLPQILIDALNFLALTAFKEVLIPFADQLATKFPSGSVKARRDFKKLLNIVGAVAYLHQFQRPIVYKSKITQYIVALPVDFFMAWHVAAEGMKETLMNIQKRSLSVLQLFKDPFLEGLTSREVTKKTRLSQNRAREILNNLVDFGYLVKDITKKEHSYALKQDTDVNATIGDFEASCLSFDEKQFEKWLDGKNLTTRYRVPWPTEYVDPLTGERHSLPYSRVLKKDEIKPDSDVKQQKNPKDTSENLIVPISSVSPKVKPLTIQEVIEKAKEKFPRGVEHDKLDFDTFIMSLGFSAAETTKLFQDLNDNGELLWRNTDGKTLWSWAK